MPVLRSKIHFGATHLTDIPTINAALHALMTLPAARKSMSSVVDELLDVSATRLHDQLLLMIAIYAIFSRKWLDAAAILRFLDESLEPNTPKNLPPRSIIRHFDGLSRLRACHFESRNIPMPDSLEQFAKIALGASHYASEFPRLAPGIARVLYIAGHQEVALSTINSALKAQPDPDSPNDVYLVVAKAFLEFSNAHWSNAATWYAKLLRHPDLRKLDWVNDLIPFVSHVTSFKIEGSDYLKALYYRIAQMPLAENMKRLARTWASADASRSDLANVLRDAGSGQFATGSTANSQRNPSKKNQKRNKN